MQSVLDWINHSSMSSPSGRFWWWIYVTLSFCGLTTFILLNIFYFTDNKSLKYGFVLLSPSVVVQYLTKNCYSQILQLL